MKVRGLRILRRTARWVTRPWRRRGLILMYHRVAEVSPDLWGLCVSPQNFGEQLEVLRRCGSLVPLRQLVEYLKADRLPHTAVALTFDDGYADNLYVAKPLLDRHSIPATVFLATGLLGQPHEFWWDELERILLQPDELPETLPLSLGGDSHERLRREATPSERHSLYLNVWKQLYQLTEGEKRRLLDVLRQWAGASGEGRSTHRALSTEELVTLTEGGLIEVGAHTVTHAALSLFSSDLQRQEIRQSKADLEEVLGHSIRSFAYPHGDYTWETVSFVRDAGFACACSTQAYSVRPQTDPFQLPRMQVQDWDGEEFERRLTAWTDGA
jgi:peptidoglycan/xylan/chitin deacetylase (PgdA/CDA1 family)